MTTWINYCDFIKSKGNIENCMIISSNTGALWANIPDSFYLRIYKCNIIQEDGNELEEQVNEALNIISLIQGKTPFQGLRINGGKKQQILRNFIDDNSKLRVIYGKFPQGGSCVAHAGKCIIIATFSEVAGHTSVGCNEVIQLMAKYLADSTWPEGLEGSNDDVISGDGTMTWQPYIDTMLVGKGNISQALICSKADGKIWASTKDFSFKTYEADITQDDGSDKKETVNEWKNLLILMNGTKPSQGLRINHIKYQILQSFNDTEGSNCYTVYGKYKKEGICIVATSKVIIIGTYDEMKGHTSAECNASVMEVGKHLKKVGS